MFKKVFGLSEQVCRFQVIKSETRPASHGWRCWLPWLPGSLRAPLHFTGRSAGTLTAAASVAAPEWMKIVSNTGIIWAWFLFFILSSFFFGLCLIKNLSRMKLEMHLHSRAKNKQTNKLKKTPHVSGGYGCGGDLKRQAKQSCHFALMFGFQCLGMHASVSVLLCPRKASFYMYFLFSVSFW